MRRAFGAAAACVAVMVFVACSSSDDRVGDPSGDPPAADSGSSPDGAAPFADGSTGSDGSAPADGASEAAVDAGPPAVQFIGRFDTTPADGPKAAWPAARILANFMGTEVKATLGDVMLFDDYGGSRWQVLIDGASTAVIQLDHTIASKQYTLATGLANGAHSVELYKLTEASVGTSQFFGFDFSGGTLLPPPLLATRHMQFLGDSSSNGYGIEGANASCSFSAATQNESFAYPALIAQTLNADHHSLGASGKGIYQDYARSDADTFPVIYQFDGITTFPHTSWDSTQYTPDVVWIMLGGNDYDDAGNGVDPAPYSQFEFDYLSLVQTIRGQHPNAHIFCSVAPSLSDAYPAGFNAYTNVKNAATAVVNARNGAGDARVYYFEFTRSQDADLTACGGHPNKAKHQAMAAEATVIIKHKTGWL